MITVMYEINGVMYSQGQPISKDLRNLPRTWHVVRSGAKHGPAYGSRTQARAAARLERKKSARAA